MYVYVQYSSLIGKGTLKQSGLTDLVMDVCFESFCKDGGRTWGNVVKHVSAKMKIYTLGLQRWFCHLWFMVNLVFDLDVILLLALF